MVCKNKNLKIYIGFTREFTWDQRKTVLDLLWDLTDVTVLNYDSLGLTYKRKNDQVIANFNECDMFLAVCSFDSGKELEMKNSHYVFDEYEIAFNLNKKRKCYLYDNKGFLQSESINKNKDLYTGESFVNDKSIIEKISKKFFPNVAEKDFKGIFTSMDGLISKIKFDFSDSHAYENRRELREKSLSSFYEWSNQTLVKLTSLKNNSSVEYSKSPLKYLYDKFMSDDVWLSNIDTILKILINSIKFDMNIALKSKNSFQIYDSFAFKNQIAAVLEKGRNKEVIYINNNTYFKTVETKIIDIIDTCIKNVIERINANGKDKEDALNQDRYILNLLRNSKSLIKNLSYGKCFLIMGGYGAGKSYFVQSLIRKMLWQSESIKRLEENCLYLYLKCPSEYLSLKLYILEYVRKVFGLEDENNYQINDLLKIINDVDNHIQQKVVFIIDDFHDWININNEYIKEVCELIAEYSNIKQIYWILTISDQAYDKVALSYLFEWTKYSTNYTILNDNECFKEIITKNSLNKKHKDSLCSDNWYIEGWLVLDELNIQNRLGIKMLYENIDNCFKLPYLLIENNPTSIKWISNPFIANILIELKDELSLETIIDLVYIDFIRKYWNIQKINLYNDIIETYKKRNEKPVSEHEMKIILEHSLRDIAEFYVRFTEDKCEFNKVKDYIMSKAGKSIMDYTQTYEIILESFQKAGMLKQVIKEDYWEGSRNDIELSFEIFWAYYISLEFIKNKHNSSNYETIVIELQKYLYSININSMCNDIFQFYLLNVELYFIKEGISKNVFKIFIQNVFKSVALVKDAIWYAGAKSGKYMQLCLTEILNDMNQEQECKGTYPLIYFLSEIRSEIISIDNRMKLLQVQYVNIRDKNLHHYFLYSIKKLFANIYDYNELVKSMKYFENCEVLEFTEELASITIQAMSKLVGDNSKLFINLIIKYLKDNHEQIKPDFKQKVETYDGLFYYIEWVVSEFCECIVGRFGVESYCFFKKNNWYSGTEIKIGKKVSLVMKQQANLKLGYWYQHTASPSQKCSYLELIKELVKSSDAKDCENAVYLIRHSRATHKQRALQVDKKFHLLLKTLRWDKKIASTVAKNIEFFNANIESKRKESEKNTK